MNVTVLGSCANQIANREGVSILVENKSDNLLIDCGPGIVAAFGRANRKTSDINNVLLTHVHGDHISGFAYFVWNRNFERMGAAPAEDLHVYGQKDTIECAKHLLAHCYPELKFPFAVIYHEIDAEFVFDCGELNIKTVPAQHTVPCVSCIITANNKKFVYTSDTIPNANLKEGAQNADILIHEGMMPQAMSALAERVKHSLAGQAGEFAKEVNAKQLILVHVAPGLLGKEGMLMEEAAEYYEGPICVPFDGTVFKV